MEVLLVALLTMPPATGPMIGIAMAFGAAIVSIMFMAAYLLQNPQLVALAREELAALIFSAFIILFWMGSDAFLGSLSTGILLTTLPPDYQGFLTSDTLGGLTNSHINLAIATLHAVEQKLKSQYMDLYMFEALIGFLSTISFPFGSPIPAVNVISFSLAPFTGLTLLSNAHTIVVEAIGYLIPVVWAKEFILIFSRDTIPIILFPIGIVLRAVPIYRRTGSSVIAICFAMYFVLPFAVILSNYLLFDMYHQPEFVYTPSTASYFGTNRGATETQGLVTGGRTGEGANGMLDEFTAPSVVGTASDQATDACAGNIIVRMLCSVKNLVSSGIQVVGGFLKSIWNIWKFMVGMTGDFFFSAFNNPLMPSSASAGLFYFIIQEVATVSPFIINIMLTTLIEIIITVTGYRSISLLIGGEAEIAGLTKVI
jgi:hypothetical protein